MNVNLVRFDCERHLGCFQVPAPKPGSLAWCHLCGTWKTVTKVVTVANKKVCGKQAKWTVGGHVVEVVCTEPPGHDADKHYDESYSAYFPDHAGQPRMLFSRYYGDYRNIFTNT